MVDGSGAVTLDRGGGYGMFAVTNQSVRLDLSGLTLRNAHKTPSPLGSPGGSLISGSVTLTVGKVRFEDNQDPIAIIDGVMEIRDSSFTDNTGVAVSGTWIRISHTAFQNPRADPIMPLWRASRARTRF